MARLIERLLNAGALRRWGYAARTAQSMPLSQLRLRRNQARSLRAHLDQLIHVADGRLALPMIGTSYFPRPHGTDWAWRPELWRGPLPVPGMSSVPAKTPLGGEVTLFHDCETSELTLRQLRNQREADLAPYGLRMDVFGFDGSFLSLAVELPGEAVNGLTRNHLIRVNAIIETEKPLEIFARLNIGARVALCGLISEYNAEDPPPGPRAFGNLLIQRALVKGFIVLDHFGQAPEAITEIAGLMQQGKLKPLETVVEGFEQLPTAINMLFDGKNVGKLVVKVG